MYYKKDVIFPTKILILFINLWFTVKKINNFFYFSLKLGLIHSRFACRAIGRRRLKFVFVWQQLNSKKYKKKIDPD